MYNEILEEIKTELQYANTKWGTQFDEKNNLNDWATYTIVYLGKALAMGNNKEEQRKYLKKATGLLVNALYWLDNMPKRHYD